MMESFLLLDLGLIYLAHRDNFVFVLRPQKTICKNQVFV